MLRHSLFTNSVRSMMFVMMLGLFLLVGLLATPQTFAAPAVPTHSQLIHQEMLGLSDFTVKLANNKTVMLHWETGSEMLILGFNLWKRSGNGEWQKMNTDLIPALSTGQVAGNQYNLRDKQVKPGKKYAYKLEVVSVDNYSAFTDPIQVKVK